MKKFDSTQGAQISKQIADSVERPIIGRVIEVFEHLKDDDRSNFEVDAEILSTRDKQVRAVPWQSPQSDEVKVPKVGDKVVIEYRGKSKKTPIARDMVYTNEHRPPKARAGMWRKRVKSDTSPAGVGDIYVESFTEYDQDQSSPAFDIDAASVERSYIRIAKKVDDLDRGEDELPVSIELFDAPADDEAYIKLESNIVDGLVSDKSWGLKIDVKTGEFKLLGPKGYGIESDGAGNFTWHHESIDFSEGTTTTL